MTNLVLFNWTIIYLYIWSYCLCWLAGDKIRGIFYTGRKDKIRYVVLMEVASLIFTIATQSWLMNKQYEVGTYLSTRWGSLLMLFVGLETSILPPWQIGYKFLLWLHLRKPGLGSKGVWSALGFSRGQSTVLRKTKKESCLSFVSSYSISFLLFNHFLMFVSSFLCPIF